MMTSKQYWDEVKAVAADVMSTRRDEDDADDYFEWLWQTIDGHEFIIYTYKAASVVVHSDNRNAWTDHFDSLPQTSAIELMAFYAMMQDVHEAIELLEQA